MTRYGNISGSVGRLLLAAVLVGALVPAWAQDSRAARVVELNGRVSVLRDLSPNATAWALDVGSFVQPGQVVVTGPDGSARLQVSDGSTVDVFPNSRVKFRANAPNWGDLVDLVLGQVRVHVQKLFTPKGNPNRVTTPTAVISVRGTTFDVKIEDEDDTTLVAVVEGVVDVYNQVVGGTVVLKDGDSVRVYRNQPLAAARVDHTQVAQKALRAAYQAMIEILYRRPGGTGGASGGGTTGSTGNGDHGKSTGTGTGTGTGGGTTSPNPPTLPTSPPQ